MQTEFPYHHANDACAHLAVLSMALLQRDRVESAESCGHAIRSIAHRSAKAESPRSYTRAYGFADCITKLELLARAADALCLPAAGLKFRTLASRPDGIPDEEWLEYVEAIATRTGQMEDELSRYDRGYQMKPEPVAELREILRQQRGVPAN